MTPVGVLLIVAWAALMVGVGVLLARGAKMPAPIAVIALVGIVLLSGTFH